METRDSFWAAVQENIKEKLGLERYSIWFRQTELMSVQEDRLVIGVPNVIIKQYLDARYTEAVGAAATELTGSPMQASFDVAPRLFRQMRATREAEMASDEQQADVRFEPGRAVRNPQEQWGFEHLIVTEGNRFAFAAAKEFAGQENPLLRFLYVSGGYGSGKSSLLQAMYALASGPGSRLRCIHSSAEDWCNEYYHAIQRKTTRLFRNRYRSCDLLLLDDIQFIQGKAGGQGELLHTVKHILAKGGRVALGGVPDVDRLQDVDPAFHAQMSRAFQVALVPPHEDERERVVEELARKSGLKATDDALKLVAQRSADSIAGAKAAINRLLLYAGVEGHAKVDLSVVVKALSGLGSTPGRSVSLNDVKHAVAEAFGLEAQQLSGRSRSRTVCRARHTALHLCRSLTEASLTEIGRAFGGLSHSSVKYGADAISQRLKHDARLAAIVETISKSLQGHG